MRTIGRFFATSLTAFLIYLLFIMSLDPRELVIGVVIALLTGLLMLPYLPLDARIFNPHRLGKGLVYIPVFLWKMILANLHIASIVIRPRLKVNPAIVKGKSKLKSKEGILALTSSITLTPGTLTVEASEDELYIHMVDPADPSSMALEQGVIQPFEKYIEGVTE